MSDKFLYETFSPALIAITIAFLVAEFIGRGKHIGRWYSFFMMLSIIPGVIGLIFSPSAKKRPTKTNSLYNILTVFLGIATVSVLFSKTDNITFIEVFVATSFLATAIYCFELSEGLVINREPKYYFENNTTVKPNEKKVKPEENNLSTLISDLTELKDKKILTDLEYNEKIATLKTKKAQEDFKNMPEFRRLKNLLDSGILTKEEFENKINLLKNNNTTTYRLVNSFSEEMAVVINDNLDYGFIDESNKLVIDFIFEHAESFIDGKSNVRYKGVYRKINKKGEFI